MKRLLFLILAALALTGQQRTTEIQTVFWVDGVQTLLTLGPSFTIKEGRVLAVVPTTPTTTRHYGQRLPFTAEANGWVAPTGATNVVGWFMGHRLTSQESASPSPYYDYTWDPATYTARPKDGTQPWASYYHVYWDYDLPVAAPSTP